MVPMELALGLVGAAGVTVGIIFRGAFGSSFKEAHADILKNVIAKEKQRHAQVMEDEKTMHAENREAHLISAKEMYATATRLMTAATFAMADAEEALKE